MTRYFAYLAQLSLLVVLLGTCAVIAAPAMAQNPVPLVNQPLLPDAIAPGGSGFTLTVNGTGFVSASVVNWNGAPRATTFLNPSQLTAAISASDIATPSTAVVTVVNPGPGGGKSNFLSFSIATPVAYSSFSRSDFSSAGGNITVVTADFDGDGMLDLASSAYNGGVIRIFLGNGDGTFRAGETYNACFPHGLAVGDFNGDGKLDLVASGLGCGNLKLLLGKGDGTFKNGGTLTTTGNSTYSVAVGDFDADGRLDLVTADWETNSISIFRGNGDGTFQHPVPYVAAPVARHIGTGDFNGDGRLDVAVTLNGAVAVLLGNGDGTFQPATKYPLGADNPYLQVADLNGDGKLDLAVADTSGSMAVLLGNGDGTFAAAVPYSTGGFSAALALADFNADGILDLFTTNYYTSTASLLLGDGDGTFGAYTTLPALSGARGLAIGDFNGDGRLDAAAGNQFVDSISIFLQTAGQGTPTSTTITSSLNPSNVGQSITFTATVTSDSGTPTGTVTFFDGTTSLGSQTLAGGSAAMSTSSLAAGSHSIKAAYQGSTDFAPSTSPILTQVVNGGLTPTTTTLTSSAHHQERFKPVTYSAAITSQSGGSVTGTVAFQDNGTTIATVTVSGNGAHYTTSYPTAGTHLIVAIYSGDASNAGSTSPTLTQFIGAGKPPFPTKTTLSIGCCALVGQPITFTARVSSLYGTIPDGDQVRFFVENRTVGIGTLVGGVTSVTTSSIPAGKHTIQAFYVGDANFKHSFAIEKYVEQKHSTTTTLVSSLNPAVYGLPVTYTVTVTSTGPDTPTGKVRLTDIGLLPLVGGVATITKDKVAVGNHAITAEYLADPVSEKSTSPVLHQVVTPASTTTTIASSANPSTSGQNVTFTATVISSTGIDPFGSVTFKAGTVTLGTVAVKDTKAHISTSALPVGSITVKATYSGAAGFTGSTASLTQTVNP